MLTQNIFNHFTANVLDPISVFKFVVKILGAYFGFIIAAATLIRLFIDRFPNFEMYGILGLLWVIFLPIIIEPTLKRSKIINFC